MSGQDERAEEATARLVALCEQARHVIELMKAEMTARALAVNEECERARKESLS